jgi:hypothetical protein
MFVFCVVGVFCSLEAAAAAALMSGWRVSAYHRRRSACVRARPARFSQRAGRARERVEKGLGGESGWMRSVSHVEVIGFDAGGWTASSRRKSRGMRVCFVRELENERRFGRQELDDDGAR